MSKRTQADWTAEDLARQAEAAAALVEFLQSVDDTDEDLVAYGIEGETNFIEAIGAALDQIDEAEMMAKALKEREATLKARRVRFEKKAEFLRGCLEIAMATANGNQEDRPLPFTLMTATATVTLKSATPEIIVSNEAALPAAFWKQPDPIIDRAALKEHVGRYLAAQRSDDDADVIEPEGDDQEPVPDGLPPGVELSAAGYTLTIRRK